MAEIGTRGSVAACDPNPELRPDLRSHCERLPATDQIEPCS